MAAGCALAAQRSGVKFRPRSRDMLRGERATYRGNSKRGKGKFSVCSLTI